ncbi:MAG: D-glycero-beta-D-manno-heptose-7-phosphate kinase [Halobacteriovoraceae bacterium]|nr:D-glycero-beta-D-manno-heptose-7-phosphate kinase [Halobacteriovoraceae bacterium]|tara:strand:- start:4875 stop:5885 length:1011 start_codon:yes stop_codon:yes gene_type:complete
MITQTRFEEILQSFEKIDPILVIGDIGIDKYTKGHVNRISPEAPVPVIEVFEEWNKLGLAANVSDNLKSLSVNTTLCGVIGEDKNGDLLENLLEELGLSTWGIVRCSERMTTFKERVVTHVQQICRVDYETNTNLQESTLDSVVHRISEFIGDHSAIILEDYGKGIFCERFLSQVLELAKKDNKFVAVDPSRNTNPLFYKNVHLLKPNRVESEILVSALGFKEKKIEKIAEILIDKLNLEKLIITLGAEGMAIVDTKENDQVKFIPTVAREVFDVSGAGDTAISTIVASIASGATLEEAAWIGNCASGVVVGKKGTALTNQKELLQFFKELNKSNS